MPSDSYQGDISTSGSTRYIHTYLASAELHIR